MYNGLTSPDRSDRWKETGQVSGYKDFIQNVTVHVNMYDQRRDADVAFPQDADVTKINLPKRQGQLFNAPRINLIFWIVMRFRWRNSKNWGTILGKKYYQYIYNDW